VIKTLTTIAMAVDIMRRLDIDAAIKNAPPETVPTGGHKDNGEFLDMREIVLAALHKARVMQPRYFTPDERLLSVTRLRNNGWKVPT
jgi:hypothetical protein